MRLYLLPISTRRTLLYCQRANAAPNEKQTLMDRVQGRAARLWTDWEKKDKGWQKKVVEYGNYAVRRIPYEEWGLKSVPPLSKKRQEEGEAQGMSRVDVVYPKTLISADRVPGILHALGTEREGLHRRRLIWCLVGMPITAPMALVPVVPNIPFFYLLYRAWSHWRALKGGAHVQFLLKNKLLTMAPSPILDDVYANQKPPLPSSSEPTTDSEATPVRDPGQAGLPNPQGETMLLSQANGKKMTQALDLPQLEVELERAIWQVETAIQKQSADEAAKASAESPAGQQPTEAAERDDKKSQ